MTYLIGVFNGKWNASDRSLCRWTALLSDEKSTIVQNNFTSNRNAVFLLLFL